MLPANSSARSSPSLESLSNRVREQEAAPCYNLCGRTSVAIAHLHLRGDRSGECGLLLFLTAAFPSGCGRLRLGHPRCPASAGRSESLRHAAGTISADCRFFRIALRRFAARGCGCFVLRRQLRLAGLRPSPSRLSSPVRISGLSLLGRPHDDAVVDADLRQRLLPSPAARDHGQASAGVAGGAYSLEPPRHPGLPGSGIAHPDCIAPLAAALVGTAEELRALFPAAGSARPLAGPGAVALSRQGCMVSGVDCNNAPTLVLRHFHPVAYSQVAPRDSFHRRLELGSRHLALVSHPAQLYRGWAVRGAVHLPADACGCTVPPVCARRELIP